MNWPHSPPHQLKDEAVYMVTAGTYMKAHFFKTEERLQLLRDLLFLHAKSSGWQLHAWAIFSNHYHFIAKSPKDASNLTTWIAQLHQNTASKINEMDQTANRKVWYQFWDTKLSIHTSYLARLNYVHQNAVKHGLVSKASDYRWCSAHQFETLANTSFVKSVYSFKVDKIKIFDEF